MMSDSTASCADEPCRSEDGGKVMEANGPRERAPFGGLLLQY
jgi:hypothetical protein